MSTAIDNKGLVLVAVLWVIMVLIVIAAAVGRNARLDTKVCAVRTDELQY
jgi:hypothetical protein